jgi:hypothetical protein
MVEFLLKKKQEMKRENEKEDEGRRNSQRNLMKCEESKVS